MSKRQSQQVIHLRVYKGKELNYDANRNIKNENQIVKLVKDTLEAKHFIDSMAQSRYCDIDVEKVVDSITGKEIKLTKKDAEEIEATFKKALFGDKWVKELTSEEKKEKAEEEAKQKETEEAKELAEVTKEYKELFGADPHPQAKLETIKAKIAEEKNKA